MKTSYDHFCDHLWHALCEKSDADHDEIEALLVGDFAPFKPENASEAVGDMSETDWGMLAWLLKQGYEAKTGEEQTTLYARAGRMLALEVDNYWLKRAEKEVLG